MKTVIFEVKADDRVMDDVLEAIRGGAMFDLETVGGHGRTRVWIGTVIMQEVKNQDESGSDSPGDCAWARIPGVTHHGCRDVGCSRDHSYGPQDPREAADIGSAAYEQSEDD